MRPDAVIFDIGNVLIEWQPERYYTREIGSDRSDALFKEVDFHAMMTRIDEGGDFSTVIEETAELHPNWHSELLWVRDRWRDIAQPEIPHSVRLLKALKARDVPVFALSNFGAQNFPISAEQFPFLGLFDRSYISGEMRLAKPDPAIYAAVEQDCSLDPGALLFADDREENIAAAAARGWQTHLFAGPEVFAQVLVNTGLLSMEEAA